MTSGLPNWGETAKGVKIIDGADNPTGSTANPLPVTVYSALAQNAVNLLLGDTAAADSFARLRTSDPTSLFDSQLQYDLSPLLWESSITNNSGSAAVAHLPNESGARLTVGANDTVVRQTRGYYRYQPGKSQLIMMTFGGFTTATDVTRRAGYFDGSNGIFYQVASSTPSFVQRSSVSGSAVSSSIPQSAWNIDKLDGTGVSGITLDTTKSQILIIDLEWLGVGRVRCGFVIGGKIIYAHEFQNSNALASSYMTTANLPLRYEIDALIGVAGTHTFTQICNQIASEGGFTSENGFPFSFSNGATLISVTTRRPVLSIRPRALFNSITNRGSIIPENVAIYSDDVTAYWEAIYGGTLTGPAFANVDATYSGVEGDVAATAITGGILIASGFSPAGAIGINNQPGQVSREIISKLPISLNIAGSHPTTPLTDILSIVATSIGAATDISAEISWRELR
jgi:hypothetical protein